MKVALYTAIYGSYDAVKPVPLNLGVPAFLFTDSVAVAEAARECGWFPRVVAHSVATLNGPPRVTAPMLNHKWWKTHPHLACADAEASIWIDGSMTVVEPEFVKKCVEALGEDDWACVPHPGRRCIYPEADVSAGMHWRYDPEVMRRQAQHYRAFHPPDWGLVATGHNIRRHTPRVLELCESWWSECVTWSHQDQLSLPVLLRLYDDVKWNMNLPWGQWWHLGEHQPTWE